jgi:hypothetical protein
MAFFSFDTSSVINGRRDLLPPVVFRSVWLNVEAAIAAGEVRSIDVVRDDYPRETTTSTRGLEPRRAFSCRSTTPSNARRGRCSLPIPN